MSENIRLYSREGWESGPWSDEPDLISKPPMLLYRQANGAWAAMLAIEQSDKDRALQFISRQGVVKLDCRSLTLDLLSFDEQSKGNEYIDCSKAYIGFKLDQPGDCRPAGTKFVKSLPDFVRQKFMQDFRKEYITAHRAMMYAQLLARVLNDNKISVVDCAA